MQLVLSIQQQQFLHRITFEIFEKFQNFQKVANECNKYSCQLTFVNDVN